MAWLRKINGRYYAYFKNENRDPTEKSWALGCKEQRAARRKLTKLEKGLHRDEFDPWAGGWKRERVTLTEAVERFLDAKEGTVRQSTLDKYESKLTAWKRDHCPDGVQLGKVSPAHVSSYVHDSDVKPPTRKSRFRHVRAFLNWAEDGGLLDDGENPIDDVSTPRGGDTEPEYLDPDQIGKILRAIDAHSEVRDGQPGPSRTMIGSR